VSNNRIVWLQLQRLRRKYSKASRRWQQAMGTNCGEARELRREMAKIDLEIDALEGRLGDRA